MLLTLQKFSVCQELQYIPGRKGIFRVQLSRKPTKSNKRKSIKVFKKIGNSPGALKDFEEDIDNFFRQKDEINEWVNEVRGNKKNFQKNLLNGQLW